MHPLVSVENLAKTYETGGQTIGALMGVSLSAESGEFVAIMGSSGSGKSTLLHLMAGLDVPTSGSVIINGSEIHRLRDRARTLFRRRHIGIIFQSFNLLPTLSAAENIALPLLIDGVAERDVRRRTQALLAQVDLGHRADHLPDALSGGEQQRVAIARALVHQPLVVLADEPTGNLDSAHAGEIWNILRQLADGGERTILAVTHESSGAAHADRVVVLKDGRVIGHITERSRDATLVAARYQELAC